MLIFTPTSVLVWRLLLSPSPPPYTPRQWGVVTEVTVHSAHWLPFIHSGRQPILFRSLSVGACQTHLQCLAAKPIPGLCVIFATDWFRSWWHVDLYLPVALENISWRQKTPNFEEVSKSSVSELFSAKQVTFCAYYFEEITAVYEQDFSVHHRMRWSPLNVCLPSLPNCDFALMVCSGPSSTFFDWKDVESRFVFNPWHRNQLVFSRYRNRPSSRTEWGDVTLSWVVRTNVGGHVTRVVAHVVGGQVGVHVGPSAGPVTGRRGEKPRCSRGHRRVGIHVHEIQLGVGMVPWHKQVLLVLVGGGVCRRRLHSLGQASKVELVGVSLPMDFGHDVLVIIIP